MITMNRHSIAYAKYAGSFRVCPEAAGARCLISALKNRDGLDRK